MCRQHVVHVISYHGHGHGVIALVHERVETINWRARTFTDLHWHIYALMTFFVVSLRFCSFNKLFTKLINWSANPTQIIKTQPDVVVAAGTRVVSRLVLTGACSGVCCCRVTPIHATRENRRSQVNPASVPLVLSYVVCVCDHSILKVTLAGTYWQDQRAPIGVGLLFFPDIDIFPTSAIHVTNSYY